MHEIKYNYSPTQNRLNSIATTGINSSSYKYDPVGNLTEDMGEHLNIAWNSSGKVTSVSGSAPVSFAYSPLGQRQVKGRITDNMKAYDFYIHDATGNIMAIYNLIEQAGSFMLTEEHIYGSSRLGIYNRNIELTPENEIFFTRGIKNYELSNHLGNVNTVISDRKRQINVLGSYLADIKSYVDYYPFGYQMAERTWQSDAYRFGFNDQEKDDEIYGEGNSSTAEFWQYDTRLGRRWNIDPVMKPLSSGYSTFNNNLIIMIAPDGDAEFYNSAGTWIGTDGQEDNLLVIITSQKVIQDAIEITTQGGRLNFDNLKHGTITDDYYAINKEVLANTSQVLNKSIKEGTYREFSKTLKVDGNVVIPIGKAQGAVEMSWNNSANVELIEGEGPLKANVSIHSHRTGFGLINGDFVSAAATIPSMMKKYDEQSDEYNFKNYDINIIVGYLDLAEGMIVDGVPKPYHGTAGAAVYDKNTKLVGQMDQKSIDNILSGKRGRYGKMYDKNK